MTLGIVERIRAATRAITQPSLEDNDGRVYVIPSLLDQLRGYVGGSSGSGSAADSGSRPPARLDGTSLIDTMCRRVSAYLAILGLSAGSLSDGLVKLSDTMTEDDDLSAAYVGEVETWRALADSLVGPPPYIPHIPCPACGRYSTIHISADMTAICVACGAGWLDARDLA